MNEKKYPNKDTNKLRSVGECRNIDRLAVHMALPKESGIILDMSAAPMDGSAHPADTRRWQKAVLAAGNSILDKAVAEKRALKDFEELAFDSCQRLYDLGEHSINLSEINRSSNGNNANNAHLTPGIFAKGEPAKFRNSAHGNDLGGVTIGGAMRAMATGIKTPEISNALSEGTNSAGGFSVPDILMAPFIDLMRNESVCFQAGAQTLALESDISSMCRIATDPTATWRVENDAIAVSDPTFESVIFAPKSLAVIVKVSRELLMDSVNIEEMLQTSLSGAIALEMDRVALNGTGSNPQPTGITVAANVNSVSMGANGAAMTNYSNLLAALQLQEEANAARPTAMVMAPRSLYKLAGVAGHDKPALEAAANGGGDPDAADQLDADQRNTGNIDRLQQGDRRRLHQAGFRHQVRDEDRNLEPDLRGKLPGGFLGACARRHATAFAQKFL